MKNISTQEERLSFLVEQFKEDSRSYRDLETPEDVPGRQQLLRALMNVRSPRRMRADVLQVQDEYLKERSLERGIVTLQEIPTIREEGSGHPAGDILSLWQGDITTLKAGAIVNAANSQMLGCFIPMHHCIDNCIHTYAGIQLREECARQMNELRDRYGPGYEQPTAVPMLTGGYNLPTEHIIHIVGPIVETGLTPELEEDLAACYRNTLELCLKNGIRSVAFCSISTGVFRFPKERACEIAVDTVSRWLAEHPGAMDRVIFNVHKKEDRSNYEKRLF